MLSKNSSRFAPEGLPKIVVEIAGFGTGVLQFSKIKPLAGEIFGQGRRLWDRPTSGEPVCARIRGSCSLFCYAKPQQFFVGNAAPKEERKPRGQFEIADAVDGRPAAAPAGSLLESEDEPGIDEHARQRRFDSVLEAAGLLALLVKAEQCLEIGITDRAPEGIAGERRQNSSGARGFVYPAVGWQTKIFRRLGYRPALWDSSVP